MNEMIIIAVLGDFKQKMMGLGELLSMDVLRQQQSRIRPREASHILNGLSIRWFLRDDLNG
jgi:hypothetical protein